MPQLPFVVRPLDLGAVSTGNERPAQLASHLGQFDTIGMVWRSNGNGNLWVRGDFGATQTVDFASIVSALAQPGTTIRVRLGATQAQVDSTAAYDSGALPLIVPAIVRDDGRYHSHLQCPATAARWWRIDIGGHVGDFEAAALVLGQRIVPANYYSPGWQYGLEDLGSLDVGRWGVADETPGRVMRTLNFKLGWMSEADFEMLFRPLVERLGKRRVAFWSFDPTAGPYRQARTYLGWLRNAPAASGGVAVTRYEIEFQILSMI